MSQILEEIFPQNTVAVISGPNLAVEVSRDLPTATVLGCPVAECAEELQRRLGSERFRIYSSDETIGIELGGALKNVFAIPAGVSDGFGLGDNSKAALVTRSLAELLRLGTAMGGNPRTFYGLSGAGDLIATCFSQHSRNRRVGEKLGRGETLEQILSGTHMVAEGIPTRKARTNARESSRSKRRSSTRFTPFFTKGSGRTRRCRSCSAEIKKRSAFEPGDYAPRNLPDHFRIKFALGDLNSGVQRFRSVVRQDRHFSLRDNFAAVDSGIDVVDRAARRFLAGRRAPASTLPCRETLAEAKDGC